jgi:hypothetical protein
MIILNIMMVVALWIHGDLAPNLTSLLSAVIAIAIMNLVVWRSGKEFPDWKWARAERGF